MIAMREHSSLTSSTMCVERMTMAFSPSSLRRFRKRTRSAGSSPAVGSSTMISVGLPRSATAMPKRWRMPPEKLPSFFFLTSCRLVCCRSAATISLRARRAVMPFEHREVVEQLLRRHVGIDAELLRQVAKRLAHFVLLRRGRRCRPGGSIPNRPPAASQSSASAWTSRRRSVRADRTSPWGRSATHP